MATTAADPRLGSARPEAPATTTTQPVLWWGLVGGIFLAFYAYLMIAWVTGPYFENVGMGPDSPPTWMKAVQITWTAVGIPLTVFLLYKLLVKPWRRDGQPTTDGLMALACMLLFIQDPWSSYVQHWFTYNAYLPNMGSWVHEIPGWMAYGKPGEQVVEPILWTPFMYCYAFFAITVIGCWQMRWVKRRWPKFGALRLWGACALFMLFVDFVLEGVLFLPLGFYTYAGGHWSLFPEAYHKFPLHEAICTAPMFATMASIRYHVDDRGRSLAERGIDDIKVPGFRKAALRFLAILGAFSVCVLAFYNIPQTLLAAHSTEWPADIQKRSYMMNGLCGTDTPRACPGPGVPVNRGNDATIPLDPKKAVPFSTENSGPFNGPIF